MSRTNIEALARELLDAHSAGGTIAIAPSARDGEFDIASAYAVEAEIERLRKLAGHSRAGRKAGFANRAMWRALKMETLVWASMYDDTIKRGTQTFSLGNTAAPKIEPEIVVKLARPLTSRMTDAAEVLAAVEWVAIGFEIIDCPFPGWSFKPQDFVADLGFHKALLVGEPVAIAPEERERWAEQLGSFGVRLLKNGELADTGSGRNSLKNPALCVGELAGTAALQAGEIISTGTLTAAQPVSAGDTWAVELEGIALANYAVRFES